MKEKKYNYYQEQLDSILPANSFGISIQLRSDGKHTKWLNLNEESLPILKKWLNENLMKLNEGAN